MSKKLQTLITVLCALPIILLIGCAGMQDMFTPTYIDQKVIDYSGEEPTSLLPFTTLLDAKRIDLAMDFVHIQTQTAINRMLEDDDLTHDYLKNIHSVNMKWSKDFQKIVFDPAGPLGFLVVAGLAGTGGALLIPRPGDKSKKRIEAESVKT